MVTVWTVFTATIYYVTIIAVKVTESDLCIDRSESFGPGQTAYYASGHSLIHTQEAATK